MTKNTKKVKKIETNKKNKRKNKTKKTNKHRRKTKKNKKGGDMQPPPVAQPQLLKLQSMQTQVKNTINDNCVKYYKKNDSFFNSILSNNSIFSSEEITKKKNKTWKKFTLSPNEEWNGFYFITQLNANIRSLDTMQIPKFVFDINISGDVRELELSIMIEDKYINCFVYHCGNWYAIMRIWGLSLQPDIGILKKNTDAFNLYYKLINISFDFDVNKPTEGTSIITVDSENFVIFNDGNSIKLKPQCFELIQKETIIDGETKIYNILEDFRNSEIYNNQEKFKIVNAWLT
jgi:hypothetical protein